MRRPELVWFGIGGVPPNDSPAAYVWEQRLHWVMMAVALMSIPALYLEELSDARPARMLGAAVEVFILLAFTAELVWMLRLTQQRVAYLRRNWLDLLVIAFTIAGLAGFGSEWVALVRLTRAVVVGMLLVRAMAASRRLFRRGGLPYVLVFAFVAMLLAGFGFFWLEPTVHSYGEGLWLAIVTGTTIGYGDFVPTTTAARTFAVVIVVVGVATMSMVTASIAALMVGEDESRMRHEMHEDIRQMRLEIKQLIDEEERSVIRELHLDVRELREDIAKLREDVRKAVAARE
jgi:voltage-gated potassium channel